MPTVTLFCHFFFLSRPLTVPAVGAVVVAPRTDRGQHFITIHSRGRWEDWRAYWFYTAVGSHSRLGLPTSPPEAQDNWAERPRIGSEFDGVLERLEFLRRAGLSSHTVFRDYTAQRISPLRARERLAWLYTGSNDSMRMFVGARYDMDQGALELMFSRTLGVLDETLTLLPPGVTPLCLDSGCNHILAALQAATTIEAPSTAVSDSSGGGGAGGADGDDSDDDVPIGLRHHRAPDPKGKRKRKEYEAPPSPSPPRASSGHLPGAPPASTPSAAARPSAAADAVVARPSAAAATTAAATAPAAASTRATGASAGMTAAARATEIQARPETASAGLASTPLGPSAPPAARTAAMTAALT